jgi:hypothetical protein
VSFGTLVLVAVTTQSLTRDFLGFGYVYTVGLSAVLASIAIIRGLSLGRLTREAVREGWAHEDLLATAEREARDEAARQSPRPPLRRQFGLYLAGLAAVLAYWLGPRQWGLAEADTALGLLIELVALAAPVALGRWFGMALEAPRDGRPGILSRFFLRVKSGWLFRLFRRSPVSAPAPALPDQPTEIYLADQARELLRALPPGERERLGGADDLLRRLERDASLLRQRIADLDQAAAAVGGPGTAERRAVGESITHAREHAVGRLGAAVSALETLRLELLRARAGLVAADGLTENLSALTRLANQIDGAIEAEEG